MDLTTAVPDVRNDKTEAFADSGQVDERKEASMRTASETASRFPTYTHWDSRTEFLAKGTGTLPDSQGETPSECSSMSASNEPLSPMDAQTRKRKRRPQPIPEDCKDDAYWERRKRNNESAKRSREMRRMKEQQTTMRVIYLEQDNLRLKTEVDMLRTELEKVREILYTRSGSFH